MEKIPVYVISLESARERRALMTEHLRDLGIDYELIDAVKGSSLDSNYRQSLNPNGNMSHGELGCYLSHIRIYERMIEQKISVALVLEDDTVMHHSVKVLIESGCQSLDFDYCFLGSEDRGDEGYVFYDSEASVKLTGQHSAYLLSSGPYCTNAYLITLDGAKKRMACAFPARTAIDHYRFLPYRPRFRAIVPMLAFVNEQSAEGALSSVSWNGLQKRLRAYWWFYALRDLLKLKGPRKLFCLFRTKFPHPGRWQSFESGLRVVRRSRIAR